jgi:hypothetical protein
MAKKNKTIKAFYTKETYLDITASEIDSLIMKRFKKDFNTAYVLEGARLVKKYVCQDDETDTDSFDTEEESEDTLDGFMTILCNEGVLEEGWYLIAFDD